MHLDHAVTLGQPASGMGFVGIKNAIAVEFDTFYNPEQLDPWENHVAVVTRGWRDPISSNHSYELGHATQYDCRACLLHSQSSINVSTVCCRSAVPDLTDGIITVRIQYTPTFNTDRCD